MLRDPRTVLARRIAAIADAQAEKRAAEAARRQAAAARREVRPQRTIRPSARLRDAQEHVDDDMDVDSASERPDAGAVEVSDSEEFQGTTRSATRKRRRTQKNAQDDEAHDEATPANLHPHDPGNFLKLCRAIRILVGRRITEGELQEADQLLREYCYELVKVCGSQSLLSFHCLFTKCSSMVLRLSVQIIIMPVTPQIQCGTTDHCMNSGLSCLNDSTKYSKATRRVIMLVANWRPHSLGSFIGRCKSQDWYVYIDCFRLPC